MELDDLKTIWLKEKMELELGVTKDYQYPNGFYLK